MAFRRLEKSNTAHRGERGNASDVLLHFSLQTQRISTILKDIRMSFYRTYRPQVIDEIDNANVRKQLLSLLSKDRKDLPHAYFFTGPKGTGKTTAARVIAKLFNCTGITKSGPCGKCEQCKSISNGSSLDVIEMDAASNRGIDEIRLLRERIGLSPVSSDYTIYIIDEVHMLTTEAFNALLKTLEEPPAHAVFVLATTDAHKVPATIKSRCVEVNFHRATRDELVNALKRVAKGEKLTIDDGALELIAAAADGSFRDAVKLLEQASLQKGNITQASVEAFIPSARYEKINTFTDMLRVKDAKSALSYIEAICQKGFDLRAFLTFVLQDLEAEMIGLVTGVGQSTWQLSDLKAAIGAFTRSFDEIRYSPVPQLPIELAVVECCLGGLPANALVPSAPSTAPAVFDSRNQGSSDSGNPSEPPQDSPPSLGLLTIEKLVDHWADFIVAMKPYNHSVAGVLRSSRPKAVEGGIVTIEAFYKFHQEKLADVKTKQILADVLKKLFGEKVKIEIVLGKK